MDAQTLRQYFAFSKNPDDRIRYWGNNALRSVVEDEKFFKGDTFTTKDGSLDFLADELRDWPPEKRAYAAAILKNIARIESLGENFVSAMVDVLGDEGYSHANDPNEGRRILSTSIRLNIVSGLMNSFKHAPPSVENELKLLSKLGDPDENVRLGITAALDQITEHRPLREESEQALQKLFEHKREDSYVRMASANAVLASQEDKLLPLWDHRRIEAAQNVVGPERLHFDTPIVEKDGKATVADLMSPKQRVRIPPRHSN